MSKSNSFKPVGDYWECLACGVRTDLDQASLHRCPGYRPKPIGFVEDPKIELAPVSEAEVQMHAAIIQFKKDIESFFKHVNDFMERTK